MPPAGVEPSAIAWISDALRRHAIALWRWAWVRWDKSKSRAAWKTTVWWNFGPS